MAAKRTGKSLFHRLPGGEKGEQQLDQITLVLFSQFLRDHGGGSEISQLGTGLWLGSKTLCLSYRSAQSLELLAVKEDQGQDLQSLIVVAPSLDSRSLTKTETAIRGHLRRAGWHRQAGRLPIRIWGEQLFLDSLQQVPLLCLRYFPEHLPDGKNRLKRILSIRSSYDRELIKLNNEIQFVGMSVYKEEASAGVEMERIYIPLRVVPEGVTDETSETVHTDPLTLLNHGARHVVLGDPGSGKSTLLRFLALAGLKQQLFQKYGIQKDERLPMLITLRRYAEELRSRPDLSLLDHAVQTAQTDLAIPSLDREFFEYSFYAGQGLVLLDGIDELPDPALKLTVRERVADFLQRYPGNTLVITSRIVGYNEEARFDGLGFSHHRVAKLSMENIETFVKDWYRARIANRPERERHAGDLIRILQDPDSRAIRELAENPLLLTIVCLVHRIDAELPDERVVLYQKCTETLLNTWHNWKLRGERESLQSRNKVERRNRSRMEAIAYWMHASMEEGGEEVRRAVVPSEALLDFLTEYIRDTERPRDEDPGNMAEIFLRFVKEKAGLLIEVGSGQYSFLHLTFQEYLTATYLRKTGETAGMAAIWPYVEQHCGDPKWHEVIRLLVGSLERADSQRYLLERILPQRGASRELDRVLVAGGCLLDGIDAAEEMQEEILSALLFQAATVESLDLLRRVLRLLRPWEERDGSHHDELFSLAREIAGKIQRAGQEFGLALILIALGWGDDKVSEITPCLHDTSSHEGRIYMNLCGSRSSSPQWSEAEESRLQSFLIAAALQSSGLNFASAVLASLVLSQPVPRFVHFLACIGLGAPGPFADLPFNCFFIRGFTPTFRWRGAQDFARARDRDRARNLARDLDRNRDQAQARKRARDLARNLDRDRDLDRALDKVENQSGGLWPLLSSDEDVCGPILDLVCSLLELSPRPQWREALKTRVLPQVPERVTLADPQVWKATKQAFLRNEFGTIECEHAASELLLDVWLWVAYHHNRPDQSPFAELASLTRASDSPFLRIAHCIRDIAYGDRSRATDLKAMVDSDDPAYRKIFEAAFWR